MRLERVRINHYGPLQVDETLTDGIQLVSGPNESGKTLLTEAVLELLTGTAPPNPRVTDSPAGFIILNDDGEYRLDTETSLLDYYAENYGFDFTPGEFRNIFVIRDADLRLADTSFYESITDRITGLRTNEIRALKEDIRTRGRLTPTELNLKDSQPANHPKTQREKALDLREDVTQYLQNARENDLRSLERRLFEARRTKQTLQTTISDLETARRRNEIAALREKLESLRAHLDERNSLPAQQVLESLEHELETLSERAATVGELNARKSKYQMASLGGLGLSVTTFLAFIAVDANAPWVLVPSLAILFAMWASYQFHAASTRLSTIEEDRASILADAREAGIQASSLDDLQTRVGELQRRHSELEQAINREHGALTRSLDLTGDQTTEVIRRADDELSKREQGLDDVHISFSEQELNDKTNELKEVEQRIERLEHQLRDHRRQLDAFPSRADELDFDYFTGDSLDVELSNLEALDVLVDELRAFVKTIDREAETARRAHGILAEMEATEGRKVENLFGDGSRAASLFDDITENDYDTIRFDAEEDTILVEHSTRGILTPHELSKGTTDQLYFSIRIALAEQLLDGSAGVFLLDDAFLASDPTRLNRQVAILEALAEDGWQFLYLTAKKDAIDRLTEVSASNHIELPIL